MRIFTHLVLAFGLCFQLGLAQPLTRDYLFDPKGAPREHALDFTHLRLEASFDAKAGKVFGRVTELFTPLQQQVDSFDIDAIDMKVNEILLNGKKVAFKNNGKSLVIFPAKPMHAGDKDSLTIDYIATPRKGLYFIGWNDSTGTSRKQIWSQGQGIDNRCWIPMYDEMNDKFTSELIVSFEAGYQVVSNGSFLGKHQNDNGSTTWHYRMQHPHAPYLIMLAIGKYDRFETHSTAGIPMYLYYYPEWKNRVNATYKYSEKMMDYLEKEIGVPYAWESYSQVPVQDFMYGAMENTTATIYGDFFEVDERAYLDKYYVGVNAHELAHQWFGDLVTARNDAHHWLQESFATYYNQLFEGEVNGQDYLNWTRRNAQVNALEESKKNQFPVAHSEGGTTRHYPKGAFVLHMLNHVCGGNVSFQRAIKHYLQSHRFGNVNSDELLLSFEETLGYSLDWFWDEWIYKGGEPHYQVEFNANASVNTFHVSQVQPIKSLEGLPASMERPAGLFKMPITFEVHFIDGSMDRKVALIEKANESVTFPGSTKKVDYVLFDPNNEILKQVSFKKNYDLLAGQALRAKSMLDRYDALVDLREEGLGKKRMLLQEVYAKEVFHATKNEIINQLVQDSLESSQAIVTKALEDKDVMVRKNVVAKLIHPSPLQLTKMEKLLSDSSYDLIATTLEKLVTVNPTNAKNYIERCRHEEGAVGKNIRLKWLELDYQLTKNDSDLKALINYSGNAYEFRIRMYAMGALKRIDYFDERLLTALCEGICNGNTRLSAVANETLSYFYNQNKYKTFIGTGVKKYAGLEWQKKLLASYISN